MPIHGDGGHAKVIREAVIIPPTGWIIAVGDNAARQRESRKYSEFALCIHPSAVVSPSAKIGDGTVVMAGAVVQANAKIGKHVIVNSRAVVEHDCVVGDFVHLAPGSILCGGVNVGEGAMIGAGAVVVKRTRVPAWYKVKALNLFYYNRLDKEGSFWARVEKSDKCWLWMGAKNHNGYGIVSKRNGNKLAHRVCWTMVNGPIPDEMNVLHACDIRDCVNPDHLFLGTQAENVKDMIAKGRYRGGWRR